MSLIWPPIDSFVLPARNYTAGSSNTTDVYLPEFGADRGTKLNTDLIDASVREPLGHHDKTARLKCTHRWIHPDQLGFSQPAMYIKARDGGTNYVNQREQHTKYGTTGTWPASTYNRMRFFFKLDGDVDYTDSGYTQEGDNMRGSCNVGTYIRIPVDGGNQHNNADYIRPSTGTNADGHCYHYYTVHGADIWQQVIINMQPQVIRNWSANSDGPQPYYKEPYALQGYPGLNYFDVMGDQYFYIFPTLHARHPSETAYAYYTAPELFTDATATGDDINHMISSLQATYDHAAKKLHLGCSLQHSTDVVGGTPGFTAEIRYRFGDTTYGKAFADQTYLTEYVTDGNVYTWFNHSHDFDMTGQDVAYIAFAVKTKEVEWGHVEIAVTRDNSLLPPMPGEAFVP